MKPPIPLTSNNELVIHFIGTGFAFTKRNYQNNLIIIKNDTHIVVDVGTKATQGLFEKGIKVSDIKTLLITHQHADHIGSLEEIALIGRYMTGKKPDLIIPKIMKRSLWTNSLKGGIAFNEYPILKIEDVFNMVYPKKNNSIARPTYEIDYKGINLKIFKTNHIPSNAKTLDEAYWSSGVLIDNRILFSGDTKFDRELLESFDDMFHPELIIHDCQFFTGGVHASYDELKTLPLEMKKRMLLSHYADNWKDFHPKDDGFLDFAYPDVLYKFQL